MTAAGVLVTSVVAPLVAAMTGVAQLHAPLVKIVVIGGFGNAALFCAATYFKGMAKQADDDAAPSFGG